MYELNSL